MLGGHAACSAGEDNSLGLGCYLLGQMVRLPKVEVMRGVREIMKIQGGVIYIIVAKVRANSFFF